MMLFALSTAWPQVGATESFAMRLQVANLLQSMRPVFGTQCFDVLPARSAKFCPGPRRASFFPDGALCELLKVQDPYQPEVGCAQVAYDPHKLKVLRGATCPLPATQVCGPVAAGYLADAGRRIALDDSALASVEPIRPHWDACLAGSSRKRKEFIEALGRVGLVTWRRRVRAQIGVFFVAKKSPDEIRMVLDCRPANIQHQSPPHSHLATTGSMSNIAMSDEWCVHSSPGSDPRQFDPHAGSVDLADGYYQFLVPEVSSWFGLGISERAGNLGIETVWDDELQRETTH